MLITLRDELLASLSYPANGFGWLENWTHTHTHTHTHSTPHWVGSSPPTVHLNVSKSDFLRSFRLISQPDSIIARRTSTLINSKSILTGLTRQFTNSSTGNRTIVGLLGLTEFSITEKVPTGEQQEQSEISPFFLDVHARLVSIRN